MEFRRLSWGDWLAGVGGVAMLVSLFLPWYSAGDTELTAWQAMALDDVILAITAVLAIGGGVVVAFPQLSSVSVASTSLAILPAAVGFVVTVYRLISPAPPYDVSLEYGAWLGLAATTAIFVGAWQGAKDEGPARRSARAEKRAAEQALARAELLKLPGEGGSSGAKPVSS